MFVEAAGSHNCEPSDIIGFLVLAERFAAELHLCLDVLMYCCFLSDSSSAFGTLPFGGKLWYDSYWSRDHFSLEIVAASALVSVSEELYCCYWHSWVGWGRGWLRERERCGTRSRSLLLLWRGSKCHFFCCWCALALREEGFEQVVTTSRFQQNGRC